MPPARRRTAVTISPNPPDGAGRTPLPGLSRLPLAEQAAAVLLERIVAGEWPVGARLPGETTIAAELGVGRSTVREAVRELAGRGVLESRQGAGVFVVATDADADWGATLRRAEVSQVLEARVAIEVEAARLAAVRRTADELASLETALDARALAARDDDDEAYVGADIALHRAIVLAAHNPVLAELFTAFLPRLRSAMLDMLRLGRAEPAYRDDHGEHRDIVAAIAAADGERAARTSRDHLTSVEARGHGRRTDASMAEAPGSA
ncbi:FadR/GntR family transcriptional regulator [Agromyces sp. NPDC056379]|uniref:FadR/GntR family transcriptional regulator n=1 Tax=unclassified Agromyces TaxID=2639701 RepID=UPI0035E377A0